MVVLRADDGVRHEALLQKILPALAVGKGHVVGPVGVGIHGDARLDDVGGGSGTAALLQVPHVAAVVEVGVGADHAPQVKAVVLDHGRQAGAIQLGVAGVDQHDILLRDLINRQQSGVGLRHPCISQNMAQFHGMHILSLRQYNSFFTPPQEKNPHFFDFPSMQTERNKVKYTLSYTTTN